MKKLTFELTGQIDNENRSLLIDTNQTFDEQGLVYDITPIFDLVDSSLNYVTASYHNRSSYSGRLDSGLRWILTEPDSKGIRHRIGISVHPCLFNKLITELTNKGYRVISIVFGISPFKH